VTSELLLFSFLAALSVTTAVLMVLQRNPVMSALLLIANFFCLAALYLLLQAQLLAVLQIAVYAGAIMVLVLFVIMLLNLGDEGKLTESLNVRSIAGIVLAVGFLTEMVYILGTKMVAMGEVPVVVGLAPAIGTVEGMGLAMFSTYLLPLQVTGLLLLSAIIGAILLAKKKTD
jgi:NADH-quinone oxidoreductase subunit J